MDSNDIYWGVCVCLCAYKYMYTSDVSALKTECYFKKHPHSRCTNAEVPYLEAN